MKDAMPQSDAHNPNATREPGISWRVKLVVALLVVLAAGVVLVTNRWLSERFTEVTRNRAELRLVPASGHALSEPRIGAELVRAMDGFRDIRP